MMTIISLHKSSHVPLLDSLHLFHLSYPRRTVNSLKGGRRGFATLVKCPFSRESYNWIREGCRSNPRIRNKLPPAQVKAIDLCSIYQLQGKGEELRMCSKFDSLYLLYASVELLFSRIHSVAYFNLFELIIRFFLPDLFLALILKFLTTKVRLQLSSIA